MSAKLATLLDNRSDNTVLAALQRLLPISKSFDVATGTLEVGSLLALEALWQQPDKIRILMGDQTTRRTKREILAALTGTTTRSIEVEKERDDSLVGLAAVRAAFEVNTEIGVDDAKDARPFAKVFKEIVDGKTVPEGIPFAVPWEDLEKKGVRVPTKVKTLRGKLNVPRERFWLRGKDEYLWAGLDWKEGKT